MNAATLHDFLSTAVSAAQSAGEIIMENLGRLLPADVETKAAFDFVTMVDRWSEERIIRTIRQRYPYHRFLTEETLKEEPGGYRWIIDPLDGTTNYIHSYPVFSVSIALENEGEIVVSVVFDPVRGELFHAIRGEGAFLNNVRIQVSPVRDLDRSLIATGFPFRAKDVIDGYLKSFKSVFEKVSDIRRAGSAAIDLAYIAAGRVEGFFELKLSPWDIAAGSMLVTEAGGVITDLGGGRDYLSTGNVVAGNTSVQPKLLEILREVFGEVISR